MGFLLIGVFLAVGVGIVAVAAGRGGQLMALVGPGIAVLGGIGAGSALMIYFLFRWTPTTVREVFTALGAAVGLATALVAVTTFAATTTMKYVQSRKADCCGESGGQ